jgi:uncharacterized hydrophobic protein (TIGR00271 family)
MSVLALITKSEQIDLVVPWAAEFATALDTRLIVLCWAYSPLIEQPRHSTVNEYLRGEVQRFIGADGKGGGITPLVLPMQVDVRGVCHPKAWRAAVELARNEDSELIVAASDDQSGKTGGNYPTNPLLRHSPCHTVILFGGPQRSRAIDRLFIGVNDSPHDGTALSLARLLTSVSSTSQVTLAASEANIEQVAFEVGRRELQELMRDAGVEKDTRFDCAVFSSRDPQAAADIMQEYDLVLLGANTGQVRRVLELTHKPTVAVVKRAPPLRPWRRSRLTADWNSRLSPADYADLLQGLRRGSRLSADFLVMLSLAAVVASMGLLQDSPAVVIGSMLLAPLMTPMLGCGLALAQANPKLGNRALTAVVVGLLATLTIGALIGLLAPGQELTPQIVARGNPTALDLVVALASAAAAAYALARPSLVGSIAGVAIATALVPPLCSVGLSLAYGSYSIAKGAALLFGTNFVAIVLSAAFTFRCMGVSSAQVGVRQRNWVFRTASILMVTAIVLYIPLHIALQRSLIEPKAQPLSFPLAVSVVAALERHVAKDPDVQLIAAGKPSSLRDRADVIIILGAPRDLDRNYAQPIIDLLRHEMRNDQLKVEIHCIRELWQESSS